MISGINSVISFKNEETVKNTASQPAETSIKNENTTVNDTFTLSDKKETPLTEAIKEEKTAQNSQISEESISKKITETPKKNSFKEGAAKVTKFLAVSEEITKGIGKGTIGAALVGAIGLTLSWFTSALPKGFKKGIKFTEPFKHPLKSMNKTHKIVTATAAAIVFAHQIFKGVLKSNQRKANIDHKLNIKHD